MDQFKLTVSRFPRTEKPNMYKEWHEINDTYPIDLTCEEAITLIGECGHSFCPAVCDERLNYENFQSTQVLALDIDNRSQVIHPAQALERLHELGLDCNTIYVTFSDPTDPGIPKEEQLSLVQRYRMLFFMDSPMDKIYLVLHALQALRSLFPEADDCHAVQIYAGGKRVIYKNADFRLTMLDLIHILQLKETESVKSKRRIGKFAEKISALPDDFIQQGNPLQEKGDVPKKANCNTILLQNAKNGTAPIRNFDWAGARAQCKLLDHFLGMKRKIVHFELIGLYLAMKRIKGGKKLWRDSIKCNPEINDNKLIEISGWYDKAEELGHTIKEKPLRYYAPTDDPARAKYYLLTDIHFSRQKEARQIDKHYHIPLTDAQWAFRYMFQEVKSDLGKGVYVFKCATGLGKTEELMHTKLDECIIAVPTHRLKNELSTRMTAAGIKHITIPELPSGVPVSIQEKYEAYLAIGSFNYANGYLRSLGTDKFVEAGLPLKEAQLLDIHMTRYFNRIKIATENTYPVLTTHKRIAHTDFPNHSTIIFDEDIIETVGEVKTVTMRDIRLTIRHLDKHSLIRKVLSRLLEYCSDPASVGIPLTRSQVIHEEEIQSIAIGQSVTEELLMAGVRSEIISMLNAEVLMIVPQDHQDPDGEKNVQFIVKNEPPKDKKIIVLSATANEFIYRKLFGQVEFFDLALVENQGAAIQYSNRGFSRASWFSKNSQLALRKISDYIGFKHVITYKSEKYQQMFRYPYQHFENIAGTDDLKGKDIVVVGTPSKPKFFYLLWASFLGVVYKPEETDLKELVVEANGFEFNFMTFENPDLRKIQFHFIEDTLIQAVGRARLIRTNAVVEVFSRLPLPGFRQMNTNDLLDSKKATQSIKRNSAYGPSLDDVCELTD